MQMLCFCRNRFEAFGTLRSAFVAAENEMPPNVRLNDKRVLQKSGFQADAVG